MPETVGTVTHTHTHTHVHSSKRNSNIELLRIIAIILIVISHIKPEYDNSLLEAYANMNNAKIDVNATYVVFAANLGQVGNAIFVICSAYFFIDKSNLKINKVFSMILDSFIISVVILAISLVCKVDITTKDIVKSIFPTLFNNNWFVGCYILFYLAHPYLNIIIEKCDRQKLLKINTVLILMYVISTIPQFKEMWYYNAFVGFIVIYFLVAYIKKYGNNYVKNKKLNFKLLVISFVLLVIEEVIVANFIDVNLNQFTNPLILLIAISMFNLFVSGKKFTSNKVNYISSMSLLVYMISENYILRGYIRPQIFLWIHENGGYQFIPLISLGLAMVVFILSLLFAMLYRKLFGKVTQKIVDKLTNIYEKVMNFYISKMIKE